MVESGLTTRALGIMTVVLLQSLALSAATAQERNASVWVTLSDQSKLLARQPDIPLLADTASTDLTIDVNGDRAFQQIDGFGASLTESSAWLLATALTDGERATLMTQLFHPIVGVGLSVLRQPMGASDFALSHYSYDDMLAGQKDPGLQQFSIARDRTFVIPALKQALQLNSGLRLMATPWSAPGWMKTLGSLIRGELKREHFASYAAYFVKFLQGYIAEGIPIESVTVQNEPHFTGEDYPGMYMTSADQTIFVRDYLAPAFAQAALPTRILAFDHNWNEPNYPLEVFSDVAARAAVAGSAFHCYAGDPSAMNAVHAAFPDKSLHVTECSLFASFTFAESLMLTTRALVIGSLRNWAQTVVTWNLALDEQHGPHTGGCTDCTGLATINRATGHVTFNGEFYALAHVSKFVQRGAYRIESTTFANQGVDDVAFRNPDGSYVLVVSNSAIDRTIKLRLGPESVTYSLRSGSVTTFTWPGGAAPRPEAWAVPGLIEAENFTDGTGYHDSTPGNSGGQYRATDVDIEVANDAGGGYNVGWMKAGEWLEYSVDVTTAGLYTIEARVASYGQGGRFHVEFNGIDKTGPMTIPDTGAWQSWMTLTRTSGPLEAGVQRMRVLMDANGTTGDVGNLNYVRIKTPPAMAPPAVGSTPFGGTAAAVPGTVQAENYDEGGQRIAYSDQSAGNTGGRYRGDDVDIEATTDTGGGDNVGWLAVGEWLKYTVNVTAPGTFTLDVRVAANGPGGIFHVEANDVDLTGPLTIPNTGGWQAWQTLTKVGVNLGGGVRVLRIVVDAAGTSGIVGNINYLRLTAAGSNPPASTNLALGRSTSSSSTANPTSQYAASSAVDASTMTRWSSTFADPQWIATDLGVPVDITRVVLRWEVAYGADYQIQISSDNATWTTIRTVIGGDGGVDDLIGLSGIGRYVRVYGTRRGTAWGYSLWEFEIYGSITQPPAPIAATEIVLYASDALPQDLHGWSAVADATSPNGIKLFTSDQGWSALQAPPPAGDAAIAWSDFHFVSSESGTYRVWLRLRAGADTKSNDSVWIQFSSASFNGNPVYRWETQEALLVGLENCQGCGVSGWGWQNGAWWLNQPTILRLPAGFQTLRVQVREDGVQLDHIVLSPVKFLDASPGSLRNDTMIVPK